MAMALFMLAPYATDPPQTLAPGEQPLLAISDTDLPVCDIGATRIASSFHAAIGETARGMHTAEEQVPLRPGMRLVFAFEEHRLRCLRQARLKADLASLLHVKSR